MDAPCWYRVIVIYTSEAGMRDLLETAVELVSAVVAGKPLPLDERLREAKRVVKATAFGPRMQAIVAAGSGGIPWMSLTNAVRPAGALASNAGTQTQISYVG